MKGEPLCSVERGSNQRNPGKAGGGPAFRSMVGCTHVAPELGSDACKSLLRRILGAIHHSIPKDHKGLVMWHELPYHIHLTAIRRSLQTDLCYGSGR